MKLFDLTGKTAVLLGGGGVLGSAMARALVSAGADLALCDLRLPAAKENVDCLASYPGRHKAYAIDATSRQALQDACMQIVADFGRIDILVNAVGGNMKSATTSDTVSFFDLPADAVSKVVDLNLFAGAILPAQIFGRVLVENPEGGVIVHISSMNAFRPLTRIPGYSAAKAAVSNFTQWLATDLARTYGEKIRVNAIAPGFFLTDQNRFLLTDQQTGDLTARGHTIIDHTPMGRFGEPDDLAGTLLWLVTDASKFVTGIVVPVDGGFSAFSGV